MDSSRPSTAGEKSTLAANDSPKGFFSRRKKPQQQPELVEKEKPDPDAAEVTVKAEEEVPPVSFTQLFRYAAVPSVASEHN